MKKVISGLFIIVLVFTMYCNINISCAAESIDLSLFIKKVFDEQGKLMENYVNEPHTGGTHGYGDYDFSNDDFSVNYTWLHACYNTVTKINSDNITYQSIAESNSADVINSAIETMNDCKDLVGMCNETGSNVKKPENINDLSNWSKMLLLNRSVAALRNITKETGKAPEPNAAFQKKIRRAVRELQTALDFKRGNRENGATDINDNYKTKFKYNKSQIADYYDRYGNRYNCDNSDNIKKLWTYKLGLDDNDATAIRTDLYVDKSDIQATKKGYDKGQRKVYKLLFGSDSNVEDIDLGNIDEIMQKGREELARITEESLNRFSTAEYDYQYTQAQKAIDEGTESKDDPDKDTVFLQPKRSEAKDATEDVITDADKFLEGNAQNIDETQLQNFSQTLYSILLGIGVVIAVIVGMIIGIKLMIAPVEQRAEAKKLLVPYVVGCIVVFGAFGIWKLAVTIMQGF